MDVSAAEAYKKDPADAIEMVTQFSVDTGDKATQDWRTFWMFLFASFRDGFTTTAPAAKQCDVAKQERDGCTSRAVPDCQELGYSEAWYKRVVADGDNARHYGVPVEHFQGEVGRLNRRKLARMDKKRLG